MKYVLRLLLSAVLISGSATAGAGPPTTLPPALASFSGQVLYIDFWASWCGPCAESFPWLNQMQSAYGKRLKIVAVNVDESHASAEQFLNAHTANFSVVFDPRGQIADYYHIEGMPSSVIVSADGHVVHQHSGFRDAELNVYVEAIEAAIRQSTTGVNP